MGPVQRNLSFRTIDERVLNPIASDVEELKMATAQNSQTTDFTRDVIGRFVCNGLDEALRSVNRTAIRPDGRAQIEARDFDMIVIGGGTFGAVLAEHLTFRDTARR